MIFSVSIVFVLVNIWHLSAASVSQNCLNYQGKQYCFMQDPMNYTAADSHCKSLSMSMASIDSPALDGWLFTNSDAQNGHVWIGLNDLNSESKFVWSNGRELGSNYQNWNETQPDDSRQNEDCVHLKTNGKWNDLPCFTENKFVCERPSIDGGYSQWSEWTSCGKTCGEGTRNRSRTCDDPEPMYGGAQCEGQSSETEVCNLGPCSEEKCEGTTCAQFVYLKKTWLEARNYCQSQFSAELLSIHTEEQQAMIQRLIGSDSESYYLGLAGKSGEKVFTYSDASMYDYSKWNPEQPDGNEGGNCVVINDGIEKGWNDVSCSSKQRFICMKTPFKRVTRPNEYHKCYCGNCYIASLNGDKYANAEATCSSYGGHLMSIHNQDEFNFVLSVINVDFEARGYWLIGMDDKAVEGQWQNIDKSPYDFQNWVADKPAENTNLNCGRIVNLNDVNKIDDFDCQTGGAFLCKLGQPFYEKNTLCN